MAARNLSLEREIRIIKSFSRNAGNYDRHAYLQKSMAERLAALLPEPLPESVLEIGCGTGIFTRRLLARSPRRLALNDIARAMVDHLLKQIEVPENTAVIIGNAETFPFPQVDLIAANAVFQWFEKPGSALKHLSASLKPGGQLVFSAFGPQTLREFRRIAQIKSPVAFLSLAEWERIIGEAGCRILAARSEIRETFTPSTIDLLKNLQQIGAAPLRLLQTGELRQRIRQYDSAYATPQGIRASWELYYFSAEKNPE